MYAAVAASADAVEGYSVVFTTAVAPLLFTAVLALCYTCNFPLLQAINGTHMIYSQIQLQTLSHALLKRLMREDRREKHFIFVEKEIC